MRVHNFGVSGTNLTKLYQAIDIPRGRRDNVGTNFGGADPTKFRRQKMSKILTRFLTTFDFDCEYLRMD